MRRLLGTGVFAGGMVVGMGVQADWNFAVVVGAFVFALACDHALRRTPKATE